MVVRNDSGTILLLVLWFVLILSILAISLGREAAVDLALTKHSIGSLKAEGLAWSGIMYAMDQIQTPEDKIPEELFKKVSLKDGYFEIGYFYKDSLSFPNVLVGNQGEVKTGPPTTNGSPRHEGTKAFGGDSFDENFRYGFQDEEQKINLNAISVDNSKILIQLVSLLGFSEDVAKTAAASIVDWQDQNTTPANAPAYHCKNRPFDQVEELLLVKGINEEIFLKLKDFVTVFPKAGGTLKVNFNTASEVVLNALTRSKAGAATNTSLEDARSLTRKMIAYRSGPDGREATPDDRSIEMEKLGLNAKEQAIFLSLVQNMTKVSHYFRVRVRGVDRVSGASVVVEAVIKREDLSIVSWRKI